MTREFFFAGEIRPEDTSGQYEGMGCKVTLSVWVKDRDPTRDDVQAAFDGLSRAFLARLATMTPDLKGLLQ